MRAARRSGHLSVDQRTKLPLIGVQSWLRRSFDDDFALSRTDDAGLRIARGLSQQRLALEANIERVSISQIERKQINLRINSLGKIASVLECKVFELLVEAGEGEQPQAILRPGHRNYTAAISNRRSVIKRYRPP